MSLGAVPHNLRLVPSGPAASPIAGQDDSEIIVVDADTGSVLDENGKSSGVIETADGGVTVDLNPEKHNKTDVEGFYGNLAETLDDAKLSEISSDLLEGIEQDDQSRQEWLNTRATGIKLLGLTLETPKADLTTSAPLDGMSTVRHPMLLEATLRFQANARGEMLPSGGPVKVRNDGTARGDRDVLAERLEKGMNHYLTVIAREYVPDTDRMLLFLGFGGCTFKKVYFCPVRRRPVSESVDAKDLIVSNTATDLANASRVTHQISMRKAMLKRMQINGAYRSCDLQTPTPMPNAVDREIADVQGTAVTPPRPQDANYTIYECYCELDIGEDGAPEGLPLPYKVTIEKDSREILEIRRNWKEDDEDYIANQVFVKYSFVPGLGFYDIGLINILGNSTIALTAAWREMLDAGMFANFPGFLFAQDSGMAKQKTNEFRIAPGTGQGINTGGIPISSAVMPLPYRDVSAGLKALADTIQETVQRVGGVAEIQVGEGKQDAPVGTTLALIEQATMIVDAVHKRLHAAQSEEFQLLKELFREDPKPLLRAVSKSQPGFEMSEQELLQALNDSDLVPAADPNTPSHMHRIMKAVAVKQMQAANPGLYDAMAVDRKVLQMIGIEDPEGLFNKEPPAPPQPDPTKMAELAAKAKEGERKAQTQMQQMALKAFISMKQLEAKDKDRASREYIEEMNTHQEILRICFEALVHPEGVNAAMKALNIVSEMQLPADPTPMLAIPHQQQQPTGPMGPQRVI